MKMFKLSQVILKCTKNGTRISSCVGVNKYSSTFVEAKVAQGSIAEVGEVKTKNVVPKNNRYRNNIVAAAFASLNSEAKEIDEIQTPFTDEKITKATTVNELLSISDGSGVSRRHALKVVSVLAEWTSSDKVQLSDFESDHRFIKLCRILTKSKNSNRTVLNSKSEDLATILSVTADDEAAKLVASITVPQMVKVMSTLSSKKRRSTLLLRALANNINRSPERLNLKQSADLLFSMTVLNFPDENLLSRISNDVCIELETPETPLKRSAAVGSILTSLGLLKYKNPVILESLSIWVVNNQDICRPQDTFSLLMTLGVLNYLPHNHEELFKTIGPQLSLSEAGKHSVWLDIVWSLVLLNQATAEQVESVLSNEFLAQIKGNNCYNFSTKLKLLNTNAFAKHLLNSYKGAMLSTDENILEITLGRSKEKIEMINSVIDTLKNLIQSEKYLKINANSGAGFLIDAIFCLDDKCTPLPLDSKSETCHRIAILSHDYHDMTKGKVELTGVNVFAKKILEAQNYKVLCIPYTDFTPRDKLINRVQYIESRLKELVNARS